MKTYTKTDSEYQENGHYIVGGVSYMSLYTYRCIQGLPMVTPEINKNIGLNINPIVCDHIKTLPDEGPFNIIKAYDLSYLKENEDNLFAK